MAAKAGVLEATENVRSGQVPNAGFILVVKWLLGSYEVPGALTPTVMSGMGANSVIVSMLQVQVWSAQNIWYLWLQSNPFPLSA